MTESARHLRDEIETLGRIAAVLADAVDPAGALMPALELLGDRFGMRFATLTLLDPEAGETRIDMASELTNEQIGLGRYRLGEGVTGKVAASGQPAVVPVPAECPDFLDRTRRGKRADTSFICIPVVIGHDVLGTLSADVSRKPEAELWDDARLLGVVAALLAQAIRIRRDARRRQAALAEENRDLRR